MLGVFSFLLLIKATFRVLCKYSDGGGRCIFNNKEFNSYVESTFLFCAYSFMSRMSFVDTFFFFQIGKRPNVTDLHLELSTEASL